MGKRTLAVAILAALGVSGAFAQEVEIPVVPISVMSDDVPKPLKREEVAAQKSSSSRHVNESPNLTMLPGVNEIVPVAVGHLNRIVTPFSEPQVTTTSAATTEVRENVVYVGTDQEQPVTMFITQKGSEAQALSLTLVPQRIPPRELFLTVGGDAVSPGMFANSKAERWETSQPYVETLRSLLRNVALGDLPQGYTLHHTEPKHPKPHCSQPGLDFSFDNGQMLIGHKLTVSIGVARNVSGQPLEFEEASCGEWNVAAVAAFPRNVLAPNQRTEIYVVTKQGQQNAPDQNNHRPSLLGGSQ